ncbi:UDP-glycosyltransferase 13-like isoform X2 [Rhodamnia argentea]|uniref:Glycosyltransferase n=1 Tax=Rhodamnia argentea TaxID=178133 RepID=A0ABM3HVP4_9MYRT|nr:UDP-glycosyltransferase 13-like isoform X2 [Rhodamnia argentea]
MSQTRAQKSTVHVALFPSSGMGHLTPFLRLAASLAAEEDVRVTFIAAHPTVSLAESHALSSFFTSFPQVIPKQLCLLPLNESSSDTDDPFYRHYEAIFLPISRAINLPNYVFFTSSARMLTLFMSFHRIFVAKAMPGSQDNEDVIEIPYQEPIPVSWFPPPLLEEEDNFLKNSLTQNGKSMIDADGILINTFHEFEQDTLTELNSTKMPRGLPPAIAIGLLPPANFGESHSHPSAWLGDQPVGSVIYVSFGSRTAMSREQIRELGVGLVRSGVRFVWMVKSKKVDQEDTEDLEDVIGQNLAMATSGGAANGIAVKRWLNQSEILGHPAIGGFLSHCGWNSVTEAVWHGVPMLAWPQHGDQKINASLVRRAGIGIWEESWGWGERDAVKGVEIAERLAEMMRDEWLKARAATMKEAARAALGLGGLKALLAEMRPSGARLDG